MTDSQLPTQYLPEGLKRIAEYAGWDAMWTLWRHYAGGRVLIPSELRPQSGFVAYLGIEHAGRLIEAFAGETLNVPKADAARRAIRDMAIRAEHAAGVHTNVLCQKYQLTYRQLQTIYRGVPAPCADTLDIFNFDFSTQGAIRHEP